MIDILVINESTAISDAQVQAMIPAFQTQWNRDLAPVWELEQAQLAWADKALPHPASSWWVVFLDDSDQANALAYHDLTSRGLPISKVFVKTILGDRASVSVGATHEICEMAVDPTINLAAQDEGGTFWAYEVCDPVEDDRYGYGVGGILVTDFVTPAWFGFKNAGGALDFQRHATAPFQVLENGYAQRFAGGEWTQVNGSRVAAAAKQRAVKPPEGSRRLRRMKKDRSKWTPSAHADERNARRAERMSRR
jgi:hypothetical protein